MSERAGIGARVAAIAYRNVMRVAGGVAVAGALLPGGGRRWPTLAGRLGALPAADQATARGGPALWLHAASVGELFAARGLLGRLRERFPGRVSVVSTLTATGLARARELPEAHLAMLLPLDSPGIVRRRLEPFRLEAFLFTETEIWPTLLDALADRGVPAIMVSGRVSERTAARARWLRPLYAPALAGVTCCMQTDDDARRIVALGADPRRVHVAGSLKFDAPAASPPAEVSRVAEALGARRMLVAGSTHEGEDEALLAAYVQLVAEYPDLVLLLAPRHPERRAAVAGAVDTAGLPLVRYTTLVAGAAPALPAGPVVVLLDAIGPLAHLYGLGVLAFVGGSLVPAGGHNVLEPARAGRGVVVGPHTENAGDAVPRLVAGGGAVQVPSTQALAPALARLLGDSERLTDMGRRARALVERGGGAVERHLKIIATRLSASRFALPGESASA